MLHECFSFTQLEGRLLICKSLSPLNPSLPQKLKAQFCKMLTYANSPETTGPGTNKCHLKGRFSVRDIFISLPYSPLKCSKPKSQHFHQLRSSSSTHRLFYVAQNERCHYKQRINITHPQLFVLLLRNVRFGFLMKAPDQNINRTSQARSQKSNIAGVGRLQEEKKVKLYFAPGVTLFST